MSWEDDNFEPSGGFGAPADQWEGEDVHLQDVKESWDVSSDEENADAKGKEPSKKSKQERIEEKKEKRRQEELKKAESQKKAKEEKTKTSLSAEEELAERKRQEELVRQSDLEMAEDLFGGVVVEKKEEEKRVPIELMEPDDSNGFDKLREALVEKITKYDKRTEYMPFLQRLCLDCCEKLNVESIRQVGTALSALATDKQRQTKSQKPKKKGKALAGGKKAEKFDSRFDDEVGDDFDDFM